VWIPSSLVALVASCGGGGGSGGDAGSPDADPDCEARPTPLKVPEQSGVAFLAHFHTGDLHVIRTDGEALRAQAPLDTGHVNRSLAADRTRQILVVVSDIRDAGAYDVDLFSYELPTDPAVDIAPPTLLHTVRVSEGKPIKAVFDEKRQRMLLQVASLEPDGGSELVTFDVADPSTPLELGRAAMPTVPHEIGSLPGPRLRRAQRPGLRLLPA
jgi:hypothetical protein